MHFNHRCTHWERCCRCRFHSSAFNRFNQANILQPLVCLVAFSCMLSICMLVRSFLAMPTMCCSEAFWFSSLVCFFRLYFFSPSLEVSFLLFVLKYLSITIVFLEISPWTGRFYSLLDPSYAKNYIPIIASVSEHQPTAWSSFYFDLHFLVYHFPVGLYFCFKNLTDANIFIILYGITAIYFAVSNFIVLMFLLLITIFFRVLWFALCWSWRRSCAFSPALVSLVCCQCPSRP